MMDESLTDEVTPRQTPATGASFRSFFTDTQRQTAAIDALTARVRELEEKLGRRPQSPLNSSVPPSTELPHVGALPSRGGTKRVCRGSQDSRSTSLPCCHPETATTLKPTACRGCGATLSGAAPYPLSRQVWEIPQPQPVLVE